MESIRNRICSCLLTAVMAVALRGPVAPLNGQEPGGTELRLQNPAPVTVRIKEATPRMLYETLAKLGGLDVAWDPKSQPELETAKFSVAASNVSFREALDYVAAITGTSWKAASATRIFVARR